MSADQTQARIYLAGQRGCSQTATSRSFHTFNDGAYFNESRKPFGNLKVFNDHALGGGGSLQRRADEDMVIWLLPTVGALNYSTSRGMKGNVEAGQSHLLTIEKGSTYELSNPYGDEIVGFLHCIISTTAAPGIPAALQSAFDLEANSNGLQSLFGGDSHQTYSNITCHIGKFDGRKDGIYTVKDAAKGIFVFVIEGAFEVQNRLLQLRDGLTLWNTASIEFEALSNDAILLLLET